METIEEFKERNGILGIGNSPRATNKHQEAISRFIQFINTLIDDEDLNDDYKCYPEWVIDPTDLNSTVPDVCIYKNALKPENYKPLVVIEITNKKEFKATCEKVTDYFDMAPSVKEVFVYNYETGAWRKYTPKKEDTKRPSYLKLLDIDLQNIVEKYKL